MGQPAADEAGAPTMPGADAVIGLTTTIPIEVLFAAGRRPVDLNNLFVADPASGARIEAAERAGFPASCCAWIKGLYGTIHHHGVGEVIGVVAGDCSETHALLDVLRHEGLTVHPFAYPHDRDPDRLAQSMADLAERLGVSLASAAAWKARLDEPRALVAAVDQAAWERGTIPSGALFDLLLACTDFAPGREAVARQAHALLEAAGEAATNRSAPPVRRIRLGCLGVPTILSDLWTVIEEAGGRVVYHEVPAQFAMLHALPTATNTATTTPAGVSSERSLGDAEAVAELVAAYRAFTYPYDAAHRIRHIAMETAKRDLDGLIHYTQSFCHRQIHDRLLRDSLSLPILTLEADRPGPVDGRTRIRIEAFLEQLQAAQRGGA